jgi:hypothetical protein
MRKTVDWVLLFVVLSVLIFMLFSRGYLARVFGSGVVQDPDPETRILVDYGSDLGKEIEEAKATKMSLCSLIKKENVPNLKDADREKAGQSEICVRSFFFRGFVQSDQVIQILNRRGYRPATFREVLVYAMSDLRDKRFRSRTVLALGSTWVLPKDGKPNEYGERFAYYSGRKLDFGVGLTHTDPQGWFDFSFLAVRK